jgi:AcrR family transcriptional regulator
VPRITEDTKQATRSRLLDTAAEEFARHGLDGANVNTISLSAGLAKGTVYNYFDSKEALFLAVIERACGLAAEAATVVPEPATTRERLRAAIAAEVEWAQTHEPFARVLVRELLNAGAALYPAVIEAAGPFLDRLAAIIRDGQRRGGIRADLPAERLGLMFLGLAEVALVQHWGSGGGWPAYQEIPDLVVRLFLEGAEPRGAEPLGEEMT